jgi:hypothetical protein
MLHEINWHDLEFELIPVEFRSTCGVPQTKWVSVGMPRIPENVINGVFYLYQSREDAEAGKNPGGTGFIVQYQGSRVGHVEGEHLYGVTNWHVALKRGFCVIRINAKSGGTDILEFGPEDWHFIPGKYDVAVVPIILDEGVHNASAISTHRFVPDPKLRHGRIGVGEDVFMIGLFIDHDGEAINAPSARFGHVSMLPDPRASIGQPNGYRGESYVIDMHSRTGFSGSPVYVYRTFGNDLTKIWGHEFDDLELDETFRPNHFRGRMRTRSLLQLLGIHWGQFPERWELKNKDSLDESRQDLILDGKYVEGMSGMTCVIPAWCIMEVLDMPVLKNLRQPAIEAANRRSRAAFGPKPESADETDNDANPNHLEDFKRLVDVAARKQPRDDQT